MVSPGLAQPTQTIPKTPKRIYQEELTPSLVRFLMNPRHDPYRAQLQRKAMVAQLNRWVADRILLAIHS